MQNGFLEDGIDLALIEFKNNWLKKDPKTRLVIKIPNYKELVKHNFPMHNETSKKIKNQQTELKAYYDKIELEKLISTLELTEKVYIVEENLSFDSVVNLIIESKGIVHFSRFNEIPIEIYCGLGLKKKLYIPDTFNLREKDVENICLYKTSKEDFSKEFNVPITSKNIGSKVNKVILSK